MENLSIHQGETLNLLLQDTDAITATITIALDTSSSPIVSPQTVTFADGEATISYSDADTLNIPTNTYMYMLSVEYDTGTEIYPDASSCDGDCTFPTLTVCASLNAGIS